jgi:hypothetical protein
VVCPSGCNFQAARHSAEVKRPVGAFTADGDGVKCSGGVLCTGVLCTDGVRGFTHQRGAILLTPRGVPLSTPRVLQNIPATGVLGYKKSFIGTIYPKTHPRLGLQPYFLLAILVFDPVTSVAHQPRILADTFALERMFLSRKFSRVQSSLNSGWTAMMRVCGCPGAHC